MSENYLNKKKIIFIFKESEANNFLKSKIKFDQVTCIKFEDFIFLNQKLGDDFNINIKYFFDLSDEEYIKIYEERKIIINNLKNNIKSQIRDFNLMEDFIDHFFHVSLNFMLTINIKIKNNLRFFFYKKNKFIEITEHKKIFTNILNNLLEIRENNFFQNYVPTKISKINFINKLIYKLLLHLLTKNKLIGFSGLDYNFKKIINNINVKNDIVFLRLVKNNNFLLSNLKNIMTLLFSKNNKKKIINLLPLIQFNKLFNNNSIKLSNINMYSLGFYKKEFIKKLILPINYIYELNNFFDFFLKNKNFKCFITYEIKMPENLVFAYNMHKRKIPVFLISHGSHTFQLDNFTRQESYINSKGLLYSKFASKNFVQSPIAEVAIKKYFHEKVNYDKSLPITWSFNRGHKIKNNIFTILHASTVKPSSVRPLLYENTREYIQNLKIIIENVILLNKNLNVKLIIRVRNLPGCSISFLKKILPKHKNIIIKNSGNLLEDLNLSNLLISYSSTTIEEALNSRIPVLLFDKKNKYNHILSSSVELPTLQKRSAIYFSNQDNISSFLKAIIKFHSIPLKDSELKKFIWIDQIQCENIENQILNTL